MYDPVWRDRLEDARERIEEAMCDIEHAIGQLQAAHYWPSVGYDISDLLSTQDSLVETLRMVSAELEEYEKADREAEERAYRRDVI